MVWRQNKHGSINRVCIYKLIRRLDLKGSQCASERRHYFYSTVSPSLHWCIGIHTEHSMG